MGEYQKPGEKRQAAQRLVGVAKEEYRSQFDDYEDVEIDVACADHVYPNWEKRWKWGAPHRRGLEIERDIGYIRITEENPISAVTVLGSGCAMPVCAVCEYPLTDLAMEELGRRESWRNCNVQNLRRQRVDGMMSQRPSSAVRADDAALMNHEMDYEPRVWEC